MRYGQPADVSIVPSVLNVTAAEETADSRRMLIVRAGVESLRATVPLVPISQTHSPEPLRVLSGLWGTILVIGSPTGARTTLFAGFSTKVAGN